VGRLVVKLVYLIIFLIRLSVVILLLICNCYLKLML
jgi:hypothetical protein